LARSARRLGTKPATVSELVSGILEELLVDHRLDDVAALLVRRDRVPPAVFRLSLPALPRELQTMRSALRRWLEDIGLAEQAREDVVTACGEICANAMAHAYAPAGGTVVLEASKQAGGLRVVVRDAGRWRPPQDGDRGRGIAIARAIMNCVEIDPGPAGTTVTMWKDLDDAR